VICEKSIPILPDALDHEERLFFRNERVPKYVPQVVIKYVLQQAQGEASPVSKDQAEPSGR